VVYLFNPFLESVLAEVVKGLERSIEEHPRPVYVLYHNPLLESVFAGWKKVGGTHQFAVYGRGE